MTHSCFIGEKMRPAASLWRTDAGDRKGRRKKNFLQRIPASLASNIQKRNTSSIHKPMGTLSFKNEEKMGGDQSGLNSAQSPGTTSGRLVTQIGGGTTN